MVAGRRLWSQHEQHSSQHQSGRGSQLGVEAVEQDGGGAGEARRVSAEVEPGGTVDQEGDREADKAKGVDEPTRPRATRGAHGHEPQQRRERRHRQQ